jgi:hypothetical protein
MPGLARQYGARENRFCARLLKLLCAQGRRSSNKSHQRVRHKQDYLVRFHGFPPTRGSIFEARRGITAYRGQLIIASSSSTPGGAEDADYAPQQRSCIATAAGRPIFLSYARRILFGRPAISSKFGDCAKEDCVLLPPVPSCHPAKCRKDRACRPPAWEPVPATGETCLKVWLREKPAVSLSESGGALIKDDRRRSGVKITSKITPGRSPSLRLASEERPSNRVSGR